MPNLGPLELSIILLVFILLFGAKKLPDLGSSVGKSIRNFKKGVSETKDDEADEQPAHTPPHVEAERPPASDRS
jgi:sec-independent protein translocase protein TatA